MTIEQEPKSTVEGEPPAYWPASGNIVVEKLSARYSEDGPKVLHDISFEIKSGERVGVGEFCAFGGCFCVVLSLDKLVELDRAKAL